MSDHRFPVKSVGLYFFTLAMVAASSMALEIVAGRALAPYVGMSLYSWTVIIAVVLAGLSVGNWIGGLISDKGVSHRLWIASMFAAASLSTLASLMLLRSVGPLAAKLDPVGHVMLLALGAFLLPSALAGVISPILTKLALGVVKAEYHGRVLGAMFALGSVGAIIGTLIAGLVLISWVGTAGSVFSIALIYGVLAIPFLTGPGRYLYSIILMIGFAIAVFFPNVLGLQTACLKESAYFCIRVDNLVFNERNSKVLALDHLAHGLNDAEDAAFLLSPYVQGVDEIVRQRFPKSVLNAFFVGGGAYTLPRAWQKNYPNGKLLVAELDPEVTKIAKERLWLELSENLSVIHGDARQALTNLPQEISFNVIFGDAFHDISVPPHLVSDEFHGIVKSRLSPDGLYAVNVVDSFRRPAFLLSLIKTLKLRFPVVEAWLDTESFPNSDARVTWIVIATNSPTPTQKLSAQYGFQRQWLRAPIDRLIRNVGEENTVTLTDDYAPVARLLAPVLLESTYAD
ncbi:MAG: fused MFS/spermidine synthase [Hyphomicrobiales bacterium]